MSGSILSIAMSTSHLGNEMLPQFNLEGFCRS